MLRARRAAVRRGFVRMGPGLALSPRPTGRRDFSWLALPLAALVAAGPWIWGYDDVGGAIATDAITAGAVVAIALGGVLFPALWAFGVMTGLWLVIAPWIVGYGDEGGPVGLADSVAGVLVCACAVSAIAAAERQTSAGSGAVARVRRRDS